MDVLFGVLLRQSSKDFADKLDEDMKKGSPYEEHPVFGLSQWNDDTGWGRGEGQSSTVR